MNVCCGLGHVWRQAGLLLAPLSPSLRKAREIRGISIKFLCSQIGHSTLSKGIMTSRGAMIVLEGGDHTGKTTQGQKLVEALNADGGKAVFWRFPDRETAIGKVISDYLECKSELEDHAVHLLFCANRWEAVPKMMEHLKNGTTLVVDRYSYSGVAFSGAKDTMNLLWCRQPEMGLPRPDAVLYLTLSVEEAAKRGGFGGERYEQTDFQKTVAQNFDVLKEDYFKFLDAAKSIEDLHEEIKSLALDIINKAKNMEIGKLWLEEVDCVESPSKKLKLENHTRNGIMNGKLDVKNGQDS